jgi:hypothetical protein
LEVAFIAGGHVGSGVAIFIFLMYTIEQEN